MGRSFRISARAHAIRHRCGVGIGMGCWLLATVSLLAQDTAGGLAALEAIVHGDLPSGGQWVTISSPEAGTPALTGYGQSAPSKVKGNAWLLPKPVDHPDGPDQLWLPGFNRVVTLNQAPEESPDEESYSLTGALADAQWTPADPSADAAELAAWLKEHGKFAASGSIDPFDHANDNNSATATPIALGVALAFQHQGDGPAAQLLADAIFTDLPMTDRAALIDKVVSQVADRAYHAAMDAFTESQDWAALASTLEGLIQRFSRGWENRTAVRALHAQITIRDSSPEGTTF